jgi:hypothetical protein
MAKPYSEDLRRRVVGTIEGGTTIPEAAEQYSVLGKGLAAQAMTDLPEHRSLGVRELQSPIQLALLDAVFRGQIFVPRQQLLIHRPANVGKRPVHNGPLGPTVVPEWRRH